jgi:hypothetical protein
VPTLDQLVTSVYRDLADDPRQVFTVAQVEDFIRGGIVELNRVAPLDTVDTIDFIDGQTEYPTTLNLIYAASLRDKDGRTVAVIDMLENGQPFVYGYTFRRQGGGGVIEVTRGMVDQAMSVEDSSRPSIRLAGYAPRPLPYSVSGDDPETGLDSDEEYAVREFAKAEGFTLLTHDRALFQQWQGQTNNTDVSPVMMMNMASGARNEWHSKRGLIRTVRRYW